MKLHGALLLSSIALVAARPLRAQLLGAPFRVNTVTTGDQIEPAAAFDGHGNFVVVWTDSVAVGNTNVTGQRYDAAFSPIGGGFRVNTTGFFGGSFGLYPSVACAASGAFVVVWTALETDGKGVVGQRFDAAGARNLFAGGPPPV